MPIENGRMFDTGDVRQHRELWSRSDAHRVNKLALLPAQRPRIAIAPKANAGGAANGARRVRDRPRDAALEAIGELVAIGVSAPRRGSRALRLTTVGETVVVAVTIEIRRSQDALARERQAVTVGVVSR